MQICLKNPQASHLVCVMLSGDDFLVSDSEVLIFLWQWVGCVHSGVKESVTASLCSRAHHGNAPCGVDLSSGLVHPSCGHKVLCPRDLRARLVGIGGDLCFRTRPQVLLHRLGIVLLF